MERLRTVFVSVTAVLFLTAVRETKQDLVGPLEVRLVGGASQREGRLEVRRPFGFWGTVCHDGFDNTDASVVCRTLGFGDSGKWVRPKNSNYSEGTGPIWLSDVTCSGNETNLGQCSSQPWGQNNCGHKEDVRVVCRGGLEIRLVGGPSEREGRVEVRKPNRRWGTVCDDGWTAAAASVVCRQLDFGEVGETVAVTPYGQGTGPVWLSGVNCTGREVDLSLCPSQPWGDNTCRHKEDVAITCRMSADIEVRLVGGATETEGRLEVRRAYGEWGTVCDDGWTITNAAVVCRQLGFFGSVSEAVTATAYGQSTGAIWLDEVSCVGNETNLGQCSSLPWGQHNCGHHEDVGIVCRQPTAFADIEVRLIGGPNETEGRLEVRRSNGVWGTVCDDSFDITDATVVCRQLQLSDSGEVVPVTPYGYGNGSIWLDDVNCFGYETNLGQCYLLPWGQHNCQHSEDVGIICNNSTDIEVRLVGGPNETEGRLEVRRSNGTWGTVCDDGFDNIDATVVCRQLQLSDLGQVVPVTPYGQGNGSIWLDDVDCHGNETNLVQCSSLPWGQHNCLHSEDVGIICNNSTDIEVRLVGGPNETEGRLEARRSNGAWGTVCDDGFDSTDATVVCRQLQLSDSGQVVSVTPYGQGVGSIWLDDVNCLGNETNLGQCFSLPWGQHDCVHSEDVGIVCNNSTASTISTASTVSSVSAAVEIRLVGGPSDREGRLEVRRSNGAWGTVCDDAFENIDATVVCRQLQLSYSGQVVPVTPYGQGNGSIWLDDIDCRGTETNLNQCTSLPWGQHNCLHSEDVGIICHNSTEDLEVRLAGGPNETEGRLEVRKANDTWGTVCDDYFDNTDATVVCRQLKLSNSGQVVAVTPYGQGNGSIWLDDVNCLGTETNIGQCYSIPWGQHDCVHSEDVGIVCNRSAD